MSYVTVNPFNNEQVKTYPNTTDEELEKVLVLDDKLFHDLKKQDLKERAKILHQLAKYLRDNKDGLAKTATIEMGKLFRESQGEVELCAIIADWFADHGAEMLAPQAITSDVTGKAEIHYHALGTLVMVEPWNFPYYQIMRVFAPNFMVGNPMILKDASNIPGSAEAFAEAVSAAGAPKGALTNLFLSYAQVGQAIADPRIQGVALTGSERGGASVAETAGKNLKKTSMELGGMDPFIILDDADLDQAEEIAWRVRLYNNGQVCCSDKRFIVMDNMYDKFIEKLKSDFSKVKMGDPMDASTTLAPMNSKKAKDKLQAQVDATIKAGAKVVYGNQPVDLPGQFFMPTILTDIAKTNPGFTTEFFGPVASVYKVHSEQEAIDLANDNPYGLGGIVFSGNPERGKKVANQIETGMVFVNNFLASLPELPFGGVKGSGYGREMSKIGQMAFVNQQLIVTAQEPDMENLAGGLVDTSSIK